MRNALAVMLPTEGQPLVAVACARLGPGGWMRVNGVLSVTRRRGEVLD